MITIQHFDGVNYTPAIEMSMRANLELMKEGLAVPEITIGYDAKVVVASIEKVPVGIMVWAEEKHVRGIWLTLSYVEHDYRLHGVFKAMWSALLEKAVDLKAERIRSSTHVNNIQMRAVGRAVGRYETYVTMVFDMPQGEKK